MTTQNYVAEVTLGLPYEEMIKTIRAANADAVIVRTGTWGCRPERNALIEAACVRQGVPFVRIDMLSGASANLATQYKRGGVVWHPNDAGMAQIADAIYAQLEPALTQ